MILLVFTIYDGGSTGDSDRGPLEGDLDVDCGGGSDPDVTGTPLVSISSICPNLFRIGSLDPFCLLLELLFALGACALDLFCRGDLDMDVTGTSLVSISSIGPNLLRSRIGSLDPFCCLSELLLSLEVCLLDAFCFEGLVLFGGEGFSDTDVWVVDVFLGTGFLGNAGFVCTGVSGIGANVPFGQV